MPELLAMPSFFHREILAALHLVKTGYRMGREARQGAIGLVINDDYFEIGFPLEEVPPSRQSKGKKGGK